MLAGPSILDDPRDAAQLDELRRQRALLGALHDDVDLALRMLTAGDPGASWRSAAQRAYAERFGELRRDLENAWRRLDEALTAVHAAILALTEPR